MAHILLVEDNPMDARLIQRVLAAGIPQVNSGITHVTKHVTAHVTAHVTWLDDGQKALSYLRSWEAGGVEEAPNLLLLDLNLPKYDGFHVLAEFRKSAAGRSLPIFLMSSAASSEIRDWADLRHLQADGYFEKPYGLLKLEQFAGRIREILDPKISASKTAAA